ncbi:unnamed protein product [Meloidogyne enterolobii]|uniref:Uncharacterized protein n=1 Tax=Meloidogyne enterolobii TaxID=390850 RepID=A0ACB0ZZR4_MELEN
MSVFHLLCVIYYNGGLPFAHYTPFSCCCLSSCYCHFSAQILFFISYSSVLVGQRALLFLLLPGEGRGRKRGR